MLWPAILLCAPLRADSSPAAIREEIGRIVREIRNSDNSDAGQREIETRLAPGHDSTIRGRIAEVRRLLRAPSEAPMSEMSCRMSQKVAPPVVEKVLRWDARQKRRTSTSTSFD